VANVAEEKEGYSGFERFLFLVTPVLFTVILLAVLMLLFNADWRKTALEIGNKVPLLSAILPDPQEPAGAAATDEQLTVENARAKLDELNAQLKEREAALKQATDKTVQQQKTIDDLKSQIDQLNKEKEQTGITTQEYEARIRSLADMYGKMSPSKAAPILESMSLEESALVLGAMPDAQRGAILERMTPKRAADVTIKLKDSDTVQDREIAALQARIRELEQQAGGSAAGLDAAELGKTFSSMQPQSAAKLLLQMASSNQSKALRILTVLDDASRSQVLAAMSAQDSKTTAQLVGKLMPANP
jgi:flagellar motility protein MotE (MotC chaperone)